MQTKLPWLCAALLGVIGWLIGYSMNSGPSAPVPGSTAATDLSASSNSGATPAISIHVYGVERDSIGTHVNRMVETTTAARASIR